ncbi:MAG: 30S ribosomal protein S14, partial [Pseudomonadota bacterium]
VRKYAEQRSNLNRIMNDRTLSEDDRFDSRIKLQKLPRDSSPVRLRNRCTLTGRPRGVYSKFGLGRSKLRDIAMSGKIPGIIKASW